MIRCLAFGVMSVIAAWMVALTRWVASPRESGLGVVAVLGAGVSLGWLQFWVVRRAMDRPQTRSGRLPGTSDFGSGLHGGVWLWVWIAAYAWFVAAAALT